MYADEYNPEDHRVALLAAAHLFLYDSAEPTPRPDQQYGAEELAHLGASNFPHDSDEGQQERERDEDNGAYYGETAEETFQHD